MLLSERHRRRPMLRDAEGWHPLRGRGGAFSEPTRSCGISAASHDSDCVLLHRKACIGLTTRLHHTKNRREALMEAMDND
jgi:hypothetical protein